MHAGEVLAVTGRGHPGDHLVELRPEVWIVAVTDPGDIENRVITDKLRDRRDGLGSLRE